MNEIATRNTAEVAATSPMQQTSATAMRLVEWAHEAHAASQLAQALVRTPFAGQFKGDADAATAAILRGHEMGLTPVTSLAAFDLIQGQPAPKAITLRALVQSHGHDLEIVEESDQRAVARYRRNGSGDWQTTEFTIEDARGLNLLGKDNWKKQPKTMLVARVTSKAARLVASDVILGIGYSAEELRDSSPAPQSTPSRTGGGLAAALAPPPQEVDTETGEIVEAPADLITPQQLKRLQILLRECGVTDRDEALAYYARVTGRDVDSSKALTRGEAGQVLDDLDRVAKGEPNLLDPATANDPSLLDGDQ